MYKRQQDSVSLSPGDTVLLYTDGVTEAVNGEGELFGLERLQETFALTPPAKDPKVVNDAVFEALRIFVGDTPQADDITCLALSRSETGP